jgi:hypothetical protein
MEVVSLGLLALASSALLTKAKLDSKKKKEAFADSLFGDVPEQKLPSDTKNFITKSASFFNPLAAILNTAKTTFTANGAIPGFPGPSNSIDNATTANLFRSVFTKPSASGINTIDDKRSEKSATIYRIPTGSVLTEAVNLCENRTPRIKMRKADGSLDITADCSVFDSNDFAGTCGVCHMNAVNSDGCNYSDNQSLYVSSRMRQEPSEEELQRRMLAENEPGDLSKNFISPTVGTCGSDPVTKKNYFSLSKDVCLATNKFLQCKAGQSFASEGCYACRSNIAGGRSFNFINSNVGLFSVRQPTTFTLGGRGKVFLQLYDENGTTERGYLGNPDNNGVFAQPQTNSISFTLTETPTRYKIPLTSIGEAAAGKYLVISLSQNAGDNSIPYVQGNFYGNLRNKTNPTTPIEEITDFAQTALDISLLPNIFPLTGNTGSFIYYQNANDGKGMRMQPAIDTNAGNQKTTAKFKVLIPYLYIDTNNIEATYCDGPFIKNANSSNLLSNNPCYSAGSATSNYNSNCLSNIFITAGCRVTGSNFPGNAAAIARLNAMGDKGTISSNINLLFKAAYSGFSNDTQMTDAAWLDAQRACFDATTVSMNPCLNLSAKVQADGPLSEQCIQYLYASGRSNDITNDQNNNGTYSAKTYTSNANAKSLFATTDALGLRTQQVKDRYCTENGTISPLNGSANKAANVALAKTKGGIAALKQYYNNIHMKANQTDMTNVERAQYVLQCYGTTLDVQADSDPTVVNGKDVAATKCGTGGKTDVGNIRYVKIFAASGKRLRLSQVVVLDARGQNVALKKSVTGSPNLISGSHELIVDGILSLTAGQDRYASNNVGNDGSININTNTYISIDLDGQYDIVQIIVFNTGANVDAQNELAGAILALYGENTTDNPGSTGIFKKQDILTAAPIQYIDITGTNPSKSCPQLMSGKRGDLLSGTTNIQNNIQQNIDSLTSSLKYQRYEVGTITAGGVNYGTGINVNGVGSSTDVKGKWIWNHPYASVNAGSTTASFYIYFDNPKTKETNYELYYNVIYCTVTATFNNGSFPPNTVVEAALKIDIKAVPGRNFITFTCKPNDGKDKIAAFAAYLKEPSGTFIGTGAGPSSDSTGWICYTSPNIVGAYAYSDGKYTNYNLNIADYGTGIDTASGSITALGSSVAISRANWVWNHPYASINAGSTPVSFYAKVNNSGTTVTTSIFYYNTVNCSVVITVNKKSLTATKGANTSVDLVPGDNLIYVTCSQSSSYSPAAFAAIIGDYRTGSSGSWFCDTSPSIAGINSAKAATGTVYKIYDTPAANNWYSDATYANYVKDTYDPGTLLTDTSAKWIWNQPEGALASGTTAAIFYYDIAGEAGEGVTYKLYFNKKGTITININGVDYSAASSGFEFKTFNGNNRMFVFDSTNRISVTVTPSGGQGGFIAYITNSSGRTISDSRTGESGWKCDTSSTWTAATSCDFVGGGSRMTYNCAKTKFTAGGCTSGLTVSDYKNTFYNKSITDMNTEVANNWAARTASSGTQQTACKGMTVCPAGYTYDSVSNKCYIIPSGETGAGIYNSATNQMVYSYNPGRWQRSDYRINLARCGNIGTGCGSTNGSSPDGNGNCQGSEGICRTPAGGCGIYDCAVTMFGNPRRLTGTTTLATRMNGKSCDSGYTQFYDSSEDNVFCYNSATSQNSEGPDTDPYNKCESGYTFNSTNKKCEKTVATVNPNF